MSDHAWDFPEEGLCSQCHLLGSACNAIEGLHVQSTCVTATADRAPKLHLWVASEKANLLLRRQQSEGALPLLECLEQGSELCKVLCEEKTGKHMPWWPCVHADLVRVLDQGCLKRRSGWMWTMPARAWRAAASRRRRAAVLTRPTPTLKQVGSCDDDFPGFA